MSSLTSTFDSEGKERLEKLGVKLTGGSSHISRTMMLGELEALLATVPKNSPPAAYREAVVERNVLGKTTDSTRQKSLRHLRELYGLDDNIPVFAILRTLADIDGASLPLLAFQVAWSRDTLLRATTNSVIDAREGDIVSPAALAADIDRTFSGQYSELNKIKIARNACSSWTQSGHLVGRTKKVRHLVAALPSAVALALFLGNAAGFHGASVFGTPWCRLLDLQPVRARSMGLEAHRAGLLNLRAIGDVVELSFPMLSDLIPAAT